MKRLLLVLFFIFNINPAPAEQDDQFQSYSTRIESWITENKKLGYFPILKLFKKALNIRYLKKDCEDEKAQEIFNIIEKVGDVKKNCDLVRVNRIFFKHLNELCKDTIANA